MYSSVDVIWTLVGTALVFFMQAGFAMLEAGLTRAKNTANILMKNLMDFCLGTVGFLLLGAGLLLGEDTLFGLIGIPNFDWITNFTDPDVCSKFFFNLVRSFLIAFFFTHLYQQFHILII